MASSVLRRGIFISRRYSAAMSSTGSDESRMSPWLMLPPAFDMVYKYYSLAEKRVLSIRGDSSESESKSKFSRPIMPDDDAEFVGSWHGWLALFNRRNNDLFLSNPLSRRHIKLPRIEHLPDDQINFRNGRGRVSKVVLSSSPDDEGCGAVMTFGPANRMAFCSPGRLRSRWSPFGELFCEDELDNPRHLRARVYEDLVYCHRRKVLTCMTPFEFDLESLSYGGNYMSELEAWDISDPRLPDWEFSGAPSPKIARLWIAGGGGGKGENTRCWVEENMGLLEKQCVQIPHLVYAEQSDQLYLVMRFAALVGPDGARLDRVPLCPIRGMRGHYPCQTVGFVVVMVNSNSEYEVVDDLNGLAMFVGVNHSLAISASDFPELKPNSIYFTDAKRLTMLQGCHDTGIFDYENKTTSPIITFTADADNPIQSSPIWFYPRCYV